MNKLGKWIVGIVVVALVIWGLVAHNKKENSQNNSTGKTTGETIKIGFVGPLTGDEANIGQNAKAAVEIAVDEVNKSGGINGKQLEVIYEDGKCNGESAISAANKLINIDKVSVILGGACSGETLGFAATANQNKTVVLSYCSSSPKITNAGDYIFRDYPSDNFQGSYAADYIYNKLGKRNAAILYSKTDWGTGIEAVFRDSFTKLGGKIVMEEGFEQTTKDFRTILAKTKASGADIIYYLGFTDTTVPTLQQAQQQKITLPFFGGDAWDDTKIWQQVGTAGEGAMYSAVSSPLSDDFKAKMKAKLGNDEIIVCTPGAYDGVKILSQVISKVGTDSTAIKNELYNVNYSGGVSAANISFDTNGDPKSASYQVKTVKNGKAE